LPAGSQTVRAKSSDGTRKIKRRQRRTHLIVSSQASPRLHSGDFGHFKREAGNVDQSPDECLSVGRKKDAAQGIVVEQVVPNIFDFDGNPVEFASAEDGHAKSNADEWFVED
jgi:hypothetical protein